MSGLYHSVPDKFLPDALKGRLIFGNREQITALEALGWSLERSLLSGSMELPIFRVPVWDSGDCEEIFVRAGNYQEAVNRVAAETVFEPVDEYDGLLVED